MCIRDRTYTATCTASSDGAKSVVISAGAYTDSVTNPNTASNTFSWTADVTAPTLTSVTLNSNNANNDISIDGNTISLAFTSSETIATPTCAIKFDGTDATNAETITNPGGGNNHLCTVVAHDSDADGSVTFSIGFTDANGNAGTAVTATTDSSAVTHDDTVPTLSAVVLSNNGDSNTRSNDGDTITVTFTGSEALLATPTCAMAFDGTAATNAESIQYSGANNIWTCTVVAHDSDADGAVTFSLGFSDAGGNAGVAVTATTDGSAVTHDDTVPTLSNIVEATTGTGEANDGDTVSLTITASENIQQPVCTFASGGAAMANTVSYSGSGTGWTASLTVANGDTNGDATFSCAFSDVAGNAGVADTTPNSGDIEVENTHPTVSTFSFDDTAMKTGDTPTLTLTFSEAVVGFASSADDVTCPNGALSTMTSSDSGVTWTGTFTPSGSTTDTSHTCDVTANSYTDDAGNNGGAGQRANYKVDTVAPTVSSITFADTALKAGETSLVTFEFSEAVAGFANGDLTIQGGTLSAVADSGDSITWTATFTPTANTEDLSLIHISEPTRPY